MGQDAVRWHDEEGLGAARGFGTALGGAEQEADGRAVLAWMGLRGEAGRACRRGPPSSHALGTGSVAGGRGIEMPGCLSAPYAIRAASAALVVPATSRLQSESRRANRQRHHELRSIHDP